MSTVEMVHKAGKKPEYKDYVSFLGTYKNGTKREDEANSDNRAGNFSLSSSATNSSSSINSDINDQPKKGFKEYLESYQSKKYSPVYPRFIKPQDKSDTTDGKLVKTEVYIEINNPANTVSNVSKVFEKSASNNNISRVSKVSKMFEKNSTDTAKTVGSKVNHFKTQISNGIDDVHEEQRKISIGEISKKFETAPQQKTIRIPLKKTPSITEKSKFFEDNNVTTVTNNRKEAEVKRNIFNEASQAFKEKEKNENSFNKVNVPLSPKPQSHSVSNNTENSPSKLNGCSSPKLQRIISQTLSNKIEMTLPKVNGSLNPSKTNETNGVQLKHETVVSVAHPVPVIPTPPPPPLPQTIAVVTIIPPNANKEESIKKSPPSLTIETSSPGSVPPPPPPPPLPSGEIPVKILKPPASPKPNLSQNMKQFPINGYNTLPKMQNGTKKDKVDGIAAPSLDKNDPRVKKLVYGALREMYGAYHDKANDYLATLPKNRVKKNNGLDSIIDSIKSQGGLERLNGRVNPQVSDVE